MNFLYFVVGFFLILVLGLIIYYIYLKLKEKEEPTDNPLVEIYFHRFAQGHRLGTIHKIIRGTNRTCIIFFPRDLDYVAIKNDKKNIVIEPIRIWVRNTQIIPNSKFSLSNHRSIFTILPNRVEDIPEDYFKTMLGNKLAELVGESNTMSERSDIYKKRMEGQENTLEELAENEKITKAFYEKLHETIKDLSKDLKDKSKPSYSTP